MLKDREVREVILHTLEELRQTIQASSRENYTKEELIDLLGQVSAAMTGQTEGR